MRSSPFVRDIRTTSCLIGGLLLSRRVWQCSTLRAPIGDSLSANSFSQAQLWNWSLHKNVCGLWVLRGSARVLTSKTQEVTWCIWYQSAWKERPLRPSPKSKQTCFCLPPDINDQESDKIGQVCVNVGENTSGFYITICARRRRLERDHWGIVSGAP